MQKMITAGLAALTLLGLAFAAPAQAQKPDAASSPVSLPLVAEDAEVKKLQEETLKLEKQLQAKPKDARLKLRVAEQNYVTGNKMMLSGKLMPRVKYSGALKYFRRTLALDPGHKKAAAEKKTIEDIYRSMGRPVPQ